MPLTRRHLVGLAGVAALGVVATGATWQIAQGQQEQQGQRSPSSEHQGAEPTTEPAGAGLLGPGTRVLFQGDSVTDARRDRANLAPNARQALGEGYAWLVAGDTLASRPEAELEFYNRGISGNVTADLLARWDRDAIALAPDVVSVLVGINDYWNKHRVSGWGGSPDRYHGELESLVGRTKQSLPKATVVICEPFVLRAGPVTDQWVREFADYRRAAAEVARSHALPFVAFQGLLDEASRVEPATTWLYDGVHPTSDGSALLAGEWARVVG